MNNYKKYLFIYFTFVVSLPVGAGDISITRIKQTEQDKSVIGRNSLSVTELARAQMWALSETEWFRYKELMSGIRGSISPSTISPIEVLGIHARTETERQRYAELWAVAMREDVDRILAFQRAYDMAGKRIHKNIPLIDINRLPETDTKKSEEASRFQSNDRILFFAHPDCPICDVLIRKLLKRAEAVEGIDIYLKGVTSGDNKAVRDWASSHHIDPEWVRKRKVTLNYDGGALGKLTSGQGEVPHILRRRGENLLEIQASEL